MVWQSCIFMSIEPEPTLVGVSFKTGGEKTILQNLNT